MINIKAPSSESVGRLQQHWPDISLLVTEVCQNINVNLVIDDPIYAFDCEIFHKDEEISLLIKLSSDNLGMEHIEAALSFGVSQIKTAESANFLKSIFHITDGQIHILVRKYLHRTFYTSAKEFSERLVASFSSSLIKELSFVKLENKFQRTLNGPIKTGFQTTLISPCFQPLVIVDNLWRQVSGLEITSAYSHFLDKVLLNSFAKIYKTILEVNASPAKKAIDEVASSLAEVVMAATFQEVTAREMPSDWKTNDGLIKLQSEIEEIVKRREEQNK